MKQRKNLQTDYRQISKLKLEFIIQSTKAKDKIINNKKNK